MAKTAKKSILSNARALDGIVEPLLLWFYGEKRSLPWREEPTPYRVWISEIMLQQTRVEAVKPYFSRFIEALPDVHALAEADEDTLLKLWEGLGYYSRARHLQEAARIVCRSFGGELPADFDALCTLPGIGRYTAGAVSSIAFGKRTAAVDGNVLRVVMRLIASSADILKESTKRAVEEALLARLPQKPGDFNQALMELGALICLPRSAARCPDCPLRRLCLAAEAGIQAELPRKTLSKNRRTEKLTILILSRNGKIALEKRPPKGLLAGLWGFPALSGHRDKDEMIAVLRLWGFSLKRLTKLPAAKHIFSHITWHMIGWQIEIEEAPLPSTFAASHIESAPSYEIHETPARYDARGKESPSFFWTTKKEMLNTYSIPSAYHSYFPYVSEI